MSILSELSSGRFVTLPRPVQFGLALAGGSICLGGTYLSMRGSPNQWIAVGIVAAGLIFVALLFLLFRTIVKWREKRKANPMAAGIAGNAAAAPQGISEPARRARLDDLRRNFEQGVEKFRAAGKNLYSVPWYVLVGEPGSGKTEAIRHCNVGFPPGLQDQLQGAGGTLNMNWWFTNAAIILDTAGRLMFEEVPPGSTNEWQEFLKLLKQSRANSPINGLLLVIPVDTLIKDSADAIEKKATKIAQQFEQIQRTLGVRFPVFVIITKCDLLNGFREFFDDLDTPQRQHQIMGWSNPAPLDERFEPAKVIAHLETVKQRLISRRQNLILDPVNTEDPQARRVDQVDALYALPDAVVNIGPRLRRYLELIFVAGEWSPKPLFLRGIYFTSSMTEGAALDDELAKALGVPVDSLPGGAIFRKDRAYFLRDLFLEKVFREKGLVTRATNADKQQQSRRMLVMGFAFFAILILFGLSFWSWWALKATLGGERNFWDSVSKTIPADIAILNPITEKYHGEEDMTIVGRSYSLPALMSENLPRVKQDLSIPAIFKPVAYFSTDINTRRRAAYRELYTLTVMQPVYSKARTQILGSNFDPKSATPEQAEHLRAAVGELMKLEFAKGTGKPPMDAPHPYVELDPLFFMALSADDYKTFSTVKADAPAKTSDRDKLQTVADWVYTPESGETGSSRDNTWPPNVLAAGTPANIDAIKAGITATLAYWESHANDDSEALGAVTQVKIALDEFQAAESRMLRLRETPIDTMNLYKEFVAKWQAEFASLIKARDNAMRAWAIASKGHEKDSLETLYTSQKSQVIDAAQKKLEALIKLTPEAPADGSKNGSYVALADIRTKLSNTQVKLKEWKTAAAPLLTRLKELDVLYLTMVKVSEKDVRRFEVQANLYEVANGTLVKDATLALPATASLTDAFAKAEKDGTDAIAKVRPLSMGILPNDPLSASIALSQFAIEASTRARKYLLADGVLAAYPKDAAGWNAAITKLAKDAPKDALVRPPVPLVTFPAGQENSFNDQFSPDAAGVVVERLDTIGKYAADKDAALKILDAADLKSRSDAAVKSFAGYRERYVEYWKDTVKAEIVFNYSDFKELSGKLDATEANITEQLKNYGDRMIYALNKVNDAESAGQIKSAQSQLSREECKAVLASWKNLGADASQVRRAILGLIANDFKTDYTVSSAKNLDSYVARYWNSLPVAALKALVSEAQRQIRDGMAELAKYERFPLAPMTNNPKDDLSQADILAARAALEKIRGAGSAAAVAVGPGVPAGAAGNRRISEGGTTGTKDVDAQLELLRGTNLLRDRQEYFDKLDKFMAALPADARPMVAVLSLNKEKLRDDPNTISTAYSFMPASQTGKLLREFSIIGSVPETANVEYAGGDLTLGFRQTPNGNIVQTETFSGPWALLRLLKSPNVNSNSLTVAGNKWSIEYVITTPAPNPQKRSLWLIIEFKQPVPELKDWPVPPRNP